MLQRVLLPHPLGPSSVTNSRGATCRETWSNTSSQPSPRGKRLVRSPMSSFGAIVPPRRQNKKRRPRNRGGASHVHPLGLLRSGSGVGGGVRRPHSLVPQAP